MKKKILVISLIIIVIMISFLLHYLLTYQKADDEARNILGYDNVEKEENYVKIDVNSDIGIIFYPGGKVEYIAYLPLLQSLSEKGINIYLVKMPFNLAIFDINAADKIIDNNNDIKEWYIGGHSLGGVMASEYAFSNEDKINGLILLGSYNNSDYSLDNTITIYGENDLLMRDDITYDKNVYEIIGGNHAGFGNYGKQSGDGDLEITPFEQQSITVDYIYEFIKKGA